MSVFLPHLFCFGFCHIYFGKGSHYAYQGICGAAARNAGNENNVPVLATPYVRPDRHTQTHRPTCAGSRDALAQNAEAGARVHEPGGGVRVGVQLLGHLQGGERPARRVQLLKDAQGGGCVEHL